MPRTRQRSSSSSRRSKPRFIKIYLLLALVVVSVIVGFALWSQRIPSSAPAAVGTSKPMILYVNQGNGVVDQSNYHELLTTAKAHGFDTIFFQVYRSGNLLFTDDMLRSFVDGAHGQGLEVFFALYLTGTNQTIPASIYSDGEDGINLDMSALPFSTQSALLVTLSSGYHSGRTAITTTDPSLALRPDMLILETYTAASKQFMHHGIIGSVGVFATSGKQDYQQQVQYALDNSDGVMVFDYAGLVKHGY